MDFKTANVQIKKDGLPFNRWWTNLNTGWKRINYILFVIYLLYTLFFLIFCMSEYDNEQKHYRWCIGIGNSFCEEQLAENLAKIVLMLITALIVPAVIYFGTVSGYQWLKEGFQEKQPDKELS